MIHLARLLFGALVVGIAALFVRGLVAIIWLMANLAEINPWEFTVYIILTVLMVIICYEIGFAILQD